MESLRRSSLLVAVLGLAAVVFLASGMGWFGGFRGPGSMGWGMMGGQGPMMGRGPMMGGAPPVGWGAYSSGDGPGGSPPSALPDGAGAPGPGGSQVVQFTPTEGGRFPLLCTVPGHVPAGMQGEVTVL